MTGMNLTVVKAANEGVPIAALGRIFSPAYSSSTVRELLHEAVDLGLILAMPREDWPPLTGRDQRTPAGVSHRLDDDDATLILRMGSRLKTTKLESHVLLTVLRRGMATRDQLHIAVENSRGNPDEPTDIKIVDVVICKLRKKLAPMNFVLHTIHSTGYEMSEAHRAAAWAKIEGDGDGGPTDGTPGNVH